MSSPLPALKIVLIDGDDRVQGGLKLALESHSPFIVTTAVGTSDKTLALITAVQPDIILIDIETPQLDGITAAQTIKTLHPDIKVMVLTTRHEGEEVLAAMAAGADAYCMKDIALDRLIQIILMISEGGVWLDPAIAKTIMGHLPDKPCPPQASAAVNTYNNVDLTEREREILGEIVSGKSNKEIAQTLTISIHTVKTHVCNIIQKLSVDDRTQAAIKALKEGLVGQA